MNRLFDIFPNPRTLPAQSRVYDLKARLDWGEPALTILDVRDRREFNLSHIRGAVPLPMNEPTHRVLSRLELDRDIYIYGETDEETAAIATQLREAGYKNVSELRGGLAAWKAVGYPVEALPLNATLEQNPQDLSDA
ncbi:MULTISPECIES: rhodanese-like domain-containing protein [unclassified Coleofasciculus]|uniref:rhodanese-like domain-containing protein n=1 Tax=unclassified Coleofasciculus TaxID=2692782 RepID=UPI00187EADE5|nr:MULTISPECIES: rhodanese-like domain-containing protein [unclassified Coleofasciculus]MBE9128419.1 rhodanese-like domain-containing protein [Coleofasciculus sp. LEGE 07081]MBE9149536.1 rhodanese-like domain-containing protein [Coleofasciculus sp. LEGE 07092]